MARRERALRARRFDADSTVHRPVRVLDSGTITDSINVLFCDFDLDVGIPQHASELTGYLDGIRRLLIDVLNEEDVWIVYHPITRVTGG